MITGVGLVTPLGSDRETSWQRLLSGERAIRQLPCEDPVWLPGSAGAPAITGRPLSDLLSGRNSAELSWLLREPTIAHAAAASTEAAEHAGIDWHNVDPARAGCVIGTSKGGVHSWQSEAAARCEHTTEAEHSTMPPSASAWWTRLAPSGPSQTVADLFNLQGAALAPVTACATGLSSILRGAELIRNGECDVVLAGSADASLTPAVMASFRKLGVLAKSSGDPAERVRPYDRNRSGFLIGEGSGIVVLESESHAKARGAKPIAEWLTGGMVCEAVGLTQLNAQPEALVWLIRDVLRRSELAPADIDYIGLHGTATKANDIAEVRAVKAAFGRHAYLLSASSLKGAIGHLLGAAGSVELASMLLAMRDEVLPPTMNLDAPDDEFDLDFVAGESKRCDISHAMKLSLGFGGHLVAGIVRAV